MRSSESASIYSPFQKAIPLAYQKHITTIKLKREHFEAVVPRGLLVNFIYAAIFLHIFVAFQLNIFKEHIRHLWTLHTSTMIL